MLYLPSLTLDDGAENRAERGAENAAEGAAENRGEGGEGGAADTGASIAAGRLPLSDTAAQRVARALLATDEDSRQAELTAALEDDGNLRRWTFAEASARGREDLADNRQAACWLAEHVLCLWTDRLIEAGDETGGNSGDESASDRKKASLGAQLPLLLRRLRRLKELETDFEHQLEHEKLEAIKEFAYGAGHEINNPLANISARAQTLLRDETDPQRRRALEAINAQAFRAHEMIADAMLFARPPKLNLEPVELGPFLRELRERFASRMEERSIQLDLQCAEEPILVHADAVQLAVAVSALCKNAMEAVGVDGHVSLGARIGAEPGDAIEQAANSESGVPAGGWGVISVTNDGPGISSETRRRIFDPFYSGREAGRGLGFGLTKCWRIVTDHGGRLDVENLPGRGARFSIRLPLSNT